MADPLEWIDSASEEWVRRGLSRRLTSRGGSPGRDTFADGRPAVNFGSNDYLGLAGDPRVVEAARRATEAFGWGAGASPLVTGWTSAHEKLAEALARFERAEAVALFASGFAANLGTIAALVGPGDAAYIDRLDHASLIDGARLSGARLRPYPHGDCGRLETLLARDRGRFRRSLIATDGVFSMDGDLAPLAGLADLAERFGAMLLVDEAHGTGVFGPDGRGASSASGVADRVPIRVGTLSKALGSIGGFVAGPRKLVDWLVNHSRTMIYSTALPPAAAAAALAALGIVEAEPWRRARLFDLGTHLRHSLEAGGVSVPSSTGPIVPVVLGDPQRALDLSARLRDRGLLVPAIRPPTVPAGTARLRISLTAAHRDEDVSDLVAGLSGETPTITSRPGSRRDRAGESRRLPPSSTNPTSA